MKAFRVANWCSFNLVIPLLINYYIKCSWLVLTSFSLCLSALECHDAAERDSGPQLLLHHHRKRRHEPGAAPGRPAPQRCLHLYPARHWWQPWRRGCRLHYSTPQYAPGWRGVSPDRGRWRGSGIWGGRHWSLEDTQSSGPGALQLLR